MLGFFKYFNFFTHSFTRILNTLGLEASAFTLQIILPVGISFYTFQTLSYSIDVYRKKLLPEKNPITFFAYVSFFPQLVAGPIERARNLLPQFNAIRHFDYLLAKEGLQQILWGLAKKILIADQLSAYVYQCYGNYEEMSGSTLYLATAAFFIQVYCDFSGYSDIAIGTGKLFGFKLSLNFWAPLFAVSSTEFWRRWHITLISWLRDYLFKPLGGSKQSRFIIFRNIIWVFVLSGLWHGASWNFIIWGAFFGVIIIVERYFIFENTVYKALAEKLPQRLFNFSGWFITISLTTLGLVWFRAESFQQATAIYGSIFSPTFFVLPQLPQNLLFLQVLVIAFISLVGWYGRKFEFGFMACREWALPLRWTIYGIFIFLILGTSYQEQPYIYFQF